MRLKILQEKEKNRPKSYSLIRFSDKIMELACSLKKNHKTVSKINKDSSIKLKCFPSNLFQILSVRQQALGLHMVSSIADGSRHLQADCAFHMGSRTDFLDAKMTHFLIFLIIDKLCWIDDSLILWLWGRQKVVLPLQ